ncbi:LemA family protein [Fusibacter tunisiensis]|uniref:LemA protein n=1 Tax=Fusibacter tunisiensis TaxID=1008308 RepID=A0ABS2MQK8_9FIRM|nr:LemA family protein [Fusibacter tunisiensis]MBM7561676.1 LemA protein [Fusibacter tunisiensis]
MGFLIFGIILLGLVVIVAGMYNNFVKLRNIVKEAFATMDVYLKKRVDLIPNLVETVKGYATHEKETLNQVIEARNKVMGSQSATEREANENALSGTLKSLFALSESYPDLKADTQFLDLQKQLQKIEEDIAQSRKYYNAVVKTFNTKVQSFPANIIAGIFGFKEEPFFTVVESERENVRVSF